VPDSDSAAHRAATLRPFVCSCTGGGLDAAWVHVTGALEVERVFALAGSAGEAAPGALELLEPPGQMSLRFAPEILIP
jgi:hypothetical protein